VAEEITKAWRDLDHTQQTSVRAKQRRLRPPSIQGLTALNVVKIPRLAFQDNSPK